MQSLYGTGSSWGIPCWTEHAFYRGGAVGTEQGSLAQSQLQLHSPLTGSTLGRSAGNEL